MNISEKTIKTLEFDKIRELLADTAMTEGAKKLAFLLTPSDRMEEVVRRQQLTTDAKRLIDIKGLPSFGDIKDISTACERSQKGAVLTPGELLEISNLLTISRGLLEYIKTNRLFDTIIDDIFERLIPNKKLEEKINRTILSADIIADDASVMLGDIRRKIRITNNRIRDMLQHYTQSNDCSKYLQDNIVTMRNGRFVIPVKVECRNEIKGLIHDTSASGATLFIEPIAVVEANNDLRELMIKETLEIERILAEISSEVSDMASTLIFNYKNITEIAFIFACAELSVRWNAVSPTINEKRIIKLIKARHPLISNDRVVPIDAVIGESYDTLIITGPNTGGKTVALKTFGLFTLMVQSGLHIPAEDSSYVCVFDRILADIGDDQSIEQSLSTFSSHMVNISSVIDELTERSLVLFDELGVGTDPIEGAALATSIIEYVRGKGVICAATTHYAELKMYALNTKGVCNAACEFDVETLRPTYKLVIGTPGKSNAFAISEKLGLPIQIIEQAKSLVSKDNRQFENLIEILEKNRIDLEKRQNEVKKLQSEYESLKLESEKKYREKLALADAELESAQKKAQGLINRAKISSEYIFDQLEQAKRMKESERFGEELDRRRRNVRANLRETDDVLDPVQEHTNEAYTLPRDLKKGDNVLVVNINKRAIVISLPDKRGIVGVRVGLVDTRTKIDNLRLIDDETLAKENEKKKKSASDFHASRARDFSPEIDLRGKNGDEAWFAVDKYFDDAIISGMHTVRLIHGKGTGALKNALWQYLKNDNRVSAYRIGMFGEGDTGVTVVELKA